MKNNKVSLIDTGYLDYKKAWDLQEELFQEIVKAKIANRNKLNPDCTKNYLLCCEHPPVYTLGKSGKMDHLLLNETNLNNIGASFYKINRGGDITFHGPGQCVVYPILDLDNFFTDIHKYMRLLEEAVIRTLADFQIIATRIEGLTGVWLEKPERKICAMGVKASRWVTMHGLALNVNTNLDYFKYIVPCGIEDKAVTSMQKELEEEVSLSMVKTKLVQYISELFEMELIHEN